MRQRLLCVLMLMACDAAGQPDMQSMRHIYEQALAVRERAYGMSDTRTAQAARDLGLFLRQWANDKAAERKAFGEAVAIDKKALGEADAQTLADEAELAAAMEPTEGESLWQRVAAGTDGALAARAYAALGEIREASGNREAARDYYQRALAKEEVVNGPAAARVAVRLNSLALVSDPPVAIPLLQRALAINVKVWGERHPETATTEVNLSGEQLAAGNVTEAIDAGKHGLAAFEDTLGPQHPRTAAAASTLADAFRANRQSAAAEKLYRRALAIDAAAYGPMHPETLNDVKALAEFLTELGRSREAEELKRRFMGGAQ